MNWWDRFRKPCSLWESSLKFVIFLLADLIEELIDSVLLDYTKYNRWTYYFLIQHKWPQQQLLYIFFSVAWSFVTSLLFLTQWSIHSLFIAILSYSGLQGSAGAFPSSLLQPGQTSSLLQGPLSFMIFIFYTLFSCSCQEICEFCGGKKNDACNTPFYVSVHSTCSGKLGLSNSVYSHHHSPNYPWPQFFYIYAPVT